jgi:3-dehydroquinate dehydratase/shikimate dehydrogenase
MKAMEAGADYVDLEDGIAAVLPRTGTSKRIVSWHNFVETPENLDAVYDRLAAQDADVVKIACFAQTPLDSLRMLDLVKRKRNAKIPLVGFCMGEFGVPSRILCQAFGSPFTYCQPTAEQALAPGMMAWDVMRDLYRAGELTPEVEVFGVIADPVGHSMSPVIHNSAFIKNQLPSRNFSGNSCARRRKC